ncbi:unnamed protein product [Acanthoscelides obtectus]|uniref:Uncharacterized protein n=1 Tax=Acanthoscelides obtectus TaxID=200917 RepID=A0A9P0JGI3_ACAOB|nr:unnamed protein product [Acanthoscelides obtectus]CAK1649953.1 hypothetical protein AOBTE_LOCUS16512 [Acanthoscelides obtectus]
MRTIPNYMCTKVSSSCAKDRFAHFPQRSLAPHKMSRVLTELSTEPALNTHKFLKPEPAIRLECLCCYYHAQISDSTLIIPLDRIMCITFYHYFI